MDELPPNARDLIEAARHADDPSAADRARIDAKARARFAAMGVTILSPPAGLETAQATGGAGQAAGTGVQGGAAAAAATGTATATKVVATAVIAGAVAFGAVRGLQTAEPEPASGPRLEAVTVSATGPVSVMDPETATEPDSVTETESVTEAEPASVAEGVRPRRRPRARRVRDRGVADDGRLAAEVALIGRVHDALQAGHNAQALRLLRAHREGFAEGALAQERRGLRVLALCGAGRLAEGRRLRQRFLSAAPGSLLAGRVRRACGSQ